MNFQQEKKKYCSFHVYNFFNKQKLLRASLLFHEVMI